MHAVYILSTVYVHRECCDCADDGESHDETFIEGVFASREAAERWAGEHSSDGPFAWSALPLAAPGGAVVPAEDIWVANVHGDSRMEIYRRDVRAGGQH